MKKSKEPIIQKIEFDAQTQEPITIQLRGDQVPNTIESKPEIKEPFDLNKTSPKQIVMTGILGIDTTSVDKRQKFFKNLFAYLFIIIVVGVLLWTGYNDFSSEEELPSWQQVWNTLSDNWYFLLFALFALFGYYFFKGMKLSIMCKSMTGKWRLKTCMETAVLGIYYNNVTPFAVGGQPFEIYHLSKNGVHGGVASSLPISTYFLNQTAFVVIAFTCIFLYTNNTLGVPDELIGVLPTLLSVAAVIDLFFSLIMPLLLIMFSLMPRFTSKLVAGLLHLGNKLRLIKNPRKTALKTYKTVIHNSRCIKKLATKPTVFTSTFLLSFLEHLSGTSIAYFVLCFFGFNWGGGILEWAQVIQLCVLINVAISFIPTPGNAGAADLSFYLLFKTGLGLSGNTKVSGYAFPAMIAWRLFSFYSTIIIGFTLNKLKKRADRRRQTLK